MVRIFLKINVTLLRWLLTILFCCERLLFCQSTCSCLSYDFLSSTGSQFGVLTSLT